MTPTRKFLVVGVAAAALAATAAAAGTIHHMTVATPDGGQALIEYSGDVAPKVRFLTPEMVSGRAPVAFLDVSRFADMARVSLMMNRMEADMDRQMAAAFQQARQMTVTPGRDLYAPELYGADLKGLPPGAQSWSVTTISTGHGVCTRSVRISSTGQDAHPQIESQNSGDCGPAAAPDPQSGALRVKAQLPLPDAPRQRI